MHGRDKHRREGTCFNERRRVSAGLRADPHECEPAWTNTSRCDRPADMEDELRSSCRASSSLSLSLRWTRDLRSRSCFRTEAGLEPAATLLARSSTTPGGRRGLFVCDDAGGGKRKRELFCLLRKVICLQSVANRGLNMLRQYAKYWLSRWSPELKRRNQHRKVGEICQVCHATKPV